MWFSHSLLPQLLPNKSSIILALSKHRRYPHKRKSNKDTLSLDLDFKYNILRESFSQNHVISNFTCSIVCEAKLYGFGRASSAADGVSMASRVPI